MRFFSRIVFICNICFLIAAALRLVELSMRDKGNFIGAIKFQPLESTLVILGYGAIFLNFFFALISIYWIFTKRTGLLPRWVFLFNLLMFPVQVYYFFFSKF